jgi:hypothetical protein
MTDKPAVTTAVARAFQVRPATDSTLGRYATESKLDGHLNRIISLLSKRMLEDRSRPRG